MAYTKKENGEYVIGGHLRRLLGELQEIFRSVTKKDQSDQRFEKFLNIAALSLGAQAKDKWARWWFFKRREKQISYLLDQLQEGRLNYLEVLDFLADRLLFAELEQMKAGVLSDASQYLLSEPNPVTSSHVLPPSLDSSSVTWRQIVRHYSYPADRFPARSFMNYDNSLSMVSGMSDGSFSFQLFPGLLSTTRPKSGPVTSGIFLSHSHADKDFAKKLARDLQMSRVRVWIDEAEIRIGDSLLSKIQSGIQEMEFLGVVLSPSSVKSEWVTRELQAAMQLEINNRKLKVLPILYQSCELPLFLLDKKYADFSTPGMYKVSFDSLVNSLLNLSPCLLSTAKEAAKLVKTTCNPLGNLCGISQQGICHQCITEKISIRGDWWYADAKTGRSTIWVLEYFDVYDKIFSTYVVADGKVIDLPTGVLDNKVKTLDFNFVDSDLAILAALEIAKSAGVIPGDANSFFVDSVLKFCSPIDDYLWFVLFFDVALRNVTFIVEVDPRTGDVVRSVRAA